MCCVDQRFGMKTIGTLVKSKFANSQSRVFGPIPEK